MLRIIDCLTQEHHYGLLSLAVAICLLGACLTVMLLRRMIQSTGHRAAFLWALSSVIGGTTIWSTHFMAMLAYDPGVPHGYDANLTLLSLAVAAGGLLTSNGVLLMTRLRGRSLVAGVLFGCTVSTMHYLGMAAYVLPGDFIWEPVRIVASVIAGAALGTVAYHRILHPVTRYCWMGGAAAMILAICAMHFTGMTAFTIFLDSSVAVPSETISDMSFGLLVAGVTAVLFLVGFASYNIEINLEKEARSKLRHAATHDHLTGLPNRLHLMSMLSETSKRVAVDTTYKAAILSIDLDLFKQVNDSHGHATGDAVLAEIARRLSEALQKSEFIARTGGDEFVAIKHGYRRTGELDAFAQRLHALIIEPISLDNAQISLGASIGIANTVDDGADLEALVVKSDQAMYRAKSMTDSHICPFNAEIDRQNSERSQLVNDLRRALTNDEFELVYQLQNTLTTLEPVGFESLLRWNHPDRGRVPPDAFIPLAEETGLIREIGLWVLRTACAEAVSWSRPFSVAVNVAPQQLVQPSFVEHVADILHETALEPHRLELEITEASMIDDQAHTLKVMHQLKAMGIRIAMDDFGTGYSSLATLQAFPFDKIKIDRSFISDVHISEQRAAIVRSTLLLGAALKIPILAEGVETEEELQFLKAENCASVQGFYFGKPLMLSEVRALMAAADPPSRKEAS